LISKSVSSLSSLVHFFLCHTRLNFLFPLALRIRPGVLFLASALLLWRYATSKRTGDFTEGEALDRYYTSWICESEALLAVLSKILLRYESTVSKMFLFVIWRKEAFEIQLC
jgi:hypothetical protein